MKYIGGYSIVRELGQGAFGRVLLGEREKGGKTEQFAIKETLSRSRDAMKAAEQEAKLLKTLDHVNVVKLFDHFISGVPKRLYMVLEFINGRELFDLMCDEVVFENLTEREVFIFIRQICSGLKYMADENVVHMDLKPENLVVSQKADQSYSTKIIDFGLAKRILPSDRVCCLNGTYGYMAPEQISFDLITPKTDMWALGCITYEMMSGYMAFDHETDLEFTRKVSKNDWTMNLDMEDGDENPFDEITEEGKDFVTKLIQPRPEKRLSAEECFDHPWFKSQLQDTDFDIGDSSVFPEKLRKSTAANKMKGLLLVQKKLRKVQARRRWKRAIKIVKATVRMRIMIKQEAPVDAIPIETQNAILRQIIANWVDEDFDIDAEMLTIYKESQEE